MVQTLFIDDLDGSAAEGTVRFGLDGTEYEIDLNAGHAQQLRDTLAAYMRAGRRVGGGSRRPARRERKGPGSGLNTTEVREWAKAQGVHSRGLRPAIVKPRPGWRAACPVARQRQAPGTASVPARSGWRAA